MSRQIGKQTNTNDVNVCFSAPGGDLQTIIDENLVPFESDVMSFIRQTVEGLDYLHRRKIAHLDIKVRIQITKVHPERNVQTNVRNKLSRLPPSLSPPPL